MLRLILLLAAYSYIQSLIAQISYTPEQISGLLAGQMISTKNSLNTKVKGTPYLNEKWQKGSIKTKKGSFEDLFLRLNIHKQQLEFQRSKSAFAFGKEVIPSFKLSNENGSFEFLYLRVDTLEKSAGKDGFYHLLAKNQNGIQLLGFYSTKLRKAEKGPYSNNDAFDSFEKKATYYLLNKRVLQKFKLSDKNSLQEFQLTRNSILSIVQMAGAIE